MSHRPLLTCSCDHCLSSFSTVSPKARFCSVRCKNAHWQIVYRRFALVDLFMDALKLAEEARMWVQLAVLKAEQKCTALAARLGYQYRAKKYCWVKTFDRNDRLAKAG